jgi:hypothetical protein
MATQYPPSGPSLSGDLLTADRFLNDTPEVYRQLRTIIQQRFVGGRLLQARTTTDSGAVLVDTSEGIYADNDPKPRTPGSNYPRTPISTGNTSLYATVEWANGADFTIEAISRRKFDIVRRGMAKIANSHAKKLDGVALSAITSAVTQGAGAGTAWATATAKSMLSDVVTGVTAITSLNMGYNPDVIVVDDVNWGKALVTFTDAGYFPREDQATAWKAGVFTNVAGLTWVKTMNGISGTALIADSTVLGGWTDEHFGGPGWVSDTQDSTDGLEVKSFFDDNTDQWSVLARRTTVPWVQEPNAAYKVTGL